MKKIIVALFLGLTASLYSQTIPQGVNYQAIALDEDGQAIPGVDIVGRPIDGAEIGVRISILENSAGGQEVYQETHDVLTDLYGMFNLVIGDGLQMSASSFSDIDWNGDKYLKVELSVENDGNFKLSAVQQLMSVPYAFLAENALVAETVLNTDDADADPENEIQQVSLRGDTILLSNGGYVVLPPDQINDSDADPNNEIQALTLSNDTVYLSNGGFIILPADQVNDADADSLNEIQTLTKVGDTISLSGGGSIQIFDGDYSNLDNTPSIPSKTSDLINDSGYLNAEIDGSVTNELQVLSISNDTLYLSDGGFVVLPPDQVNDADPDPTNEIQTLTKSGGTVSLSSGGTISVFDGDYGNLSNQPIVPTKTSDLTNDSGFITAEVDGSMTNELQTLSLSNDTIFLSDGGFVSLAHTSIGASGAVSSLDLEEYPFELKYTGNGKAGRYDSKDTSSYLNQPGWAGYQTNGSIRVLQFKDFFLRTNDVFDIPSGTTYILVQDTCLINGTINGEGLTGSYPTVFTNGIGANVGTYLGDDSGACHEIDNSSNSLTVTNQDKSLIRFNTRPGSIIRTLTDTNLLITASHYGNISGMSSEAKYAACSNNYNYVRSEGGRGLVIIAKYFISNSGLIRLKGQMGLQSGVNISGAGGGGSCVISTDVRNTNNLIIDTSGGNPWPNSGLTKGENGRAVFVDL